MLYAPGLMRMVWDTNLARLLANPTVEGRRKASG